MGTNNNRQASKKETTPTPKPGRPVLAWSVGLAMGVAIGYWLHWEQGRADRGELITDETTDEAADLITDAPRFEFYHLLTEQEVAIELEDQPGEAASVPMLGELALPSAEEEDEVVEQRSLPETATAEPSPSPSGTRYLLQAGSFRQAADADALRANLALIGIEARIQIVELPGGETWHRVRIGPFNDLREVNQARARMAANQIDAIMLRTGG